MEVTAPSLHNILPKKVLVSTIREHWFSKLVLFSVQQLSTSAVPISPHWLQREHTQNKVWVAQVQTSTQKCLLASGSFRGTTGKGDGYANVRGAIIQGRKCRSLHSKPAFNCDSSMGVPPEQVPEWSGHLKSSCSAEGDTLLPPAAAEIPITSVISWYFKAPWHFSSFNAKEDSKACI